MNPPSLVIQLIAGVAGSILIGSLYPDFDFGSMANSLLGMLGGILGSGSLVRTVGGDDNPPDIQMLLLSFTGGLLGGALLTIFGGLLKSLFNRI